MRQGKSQTRTNNGLMKQMHLLEEAAIGHLDNLECPKCRHMAVSVWFSHPVPDVYRTWFICADCDFHSRAQNTEKPRFFSDDRVNTVLEEGDIAIVRQSIFKRPP